MPAKTVRGTLQIQVVARSAGVRSLHSRGAARHSTDSVHRRRQREIGGNSSPVPWTANPVRTLRFAYGYPARSTGYACNKTTATLKNPRQMPLLGSIDDNNRASLKNAPPKGTGNHVQFNTPALPRVSVEGFHWFSTDVR